MIAASRTVSYNNNVSSVRGQPTLHRDVDSLAGEAGRKNEGGAVFNEGDVGRPKIANVKLFAQAAERKTLAILARK